MDVIGIDTYEKTTSWASALNGAGVNINNVVAFAKAHNKLFAISETAAHNCDGAYLTSLIGFMDSLGTQAAYISYFDEGAANNGDNIIWETTGTDACPANTLQAAINASSVGKKKFGGTWMK